VPANELEYLASGDKIPDLLLWGGLFSRITAAELRVAAGTGRSIEIRP